MSDDGPSMGEYEESLLWHDEEEPDQVNEPLPIPEIMNVKEVAAYLRLHRSTVYRHLRTARIPYFKVGTDFRFYRKDIDKWRLGRITAIDCAVGANNGTT